MTRAKSVRMDIVLTEDIRKLIDRAIAGGRYGGASHYVRALIVDASKKSGDPRARKISPVMKTGRPRKVA